MHGEEYECLVTAIALIDAAQEALENSPNPDAQEEAIELHHMRNRLNSQRVATLGNGQERPWHVSDLSIPPL